MDDCDFVALITATACALSKCCTEDEISILAVGFTQLGDTLTTLITQRQIRENITNAKSEAKNDKDKQ